MAALQPAQLIAATPTIFARQESQAHFFRRVSHLNLQQKRLVSLSGIERCENLRFLFAFGNRLTEIPPAARVLPALEILTLDENDVGEIHNLDLSARLRKLHLSLNHVRRVEGLEACVNLEELHLSRQRCGGERLEFDAPSMRAVGRSLRWLDVSGCFLRSLADLAPCIQVRL